MNFPRCRWGAQLYGAGHWDWNSWRREGLCNQWRRHSHLHSACHSLRTFVCYLSCANNFMLFVVLSITLKEKLFYFADPTLKVRQVKMQFISQNWQASYRCLTVQMVPFLGILDFLEDAGLILEIQKAMQSWDYWWKIISRSWWERGTMLIFLMFPICVLILCTISPFFFWDKFPFAFTGTQAIGVAPDNTASSYPISCPSIF